MHGSTSPSAHVRRIPSLYRKHFAECRKERQFISSASFFVTFGIVRAITHAIRAGVGPFRNVTPGGRHIHHMTFGIVGLLVVGYLWMLEVGTAAAHRRSSRLTSGAYGAGAALTLDEFALWLNLQDVYWAKQGRESIDAVVLFGSLLSMGLVGKEFLRELVKAEEEVEHEGEEHLEQHPNGADSSAGASIRQN
jgi:hypothetical protein